MKNIIVVLLIVLSTSSFAQKIKLLEGSLKPLKGQTAIKVEFSYDDMAVGKYADENQYVAKRKTELNEKEPGRGDKWEAAWFADRHERFEPQFRELFSKHAEVTTVNEEATYTLVFKTKKTEPGWNVGISRMPAFIDGEAWIVETKNPSNVVAKIMINRALGRDVWGFDYETGARLQEAYAKAGKELGGFIRKQSAK